jgi:protein O-GlcNAc transferase
MNAGHYDQAEQILRRHVQKEPKDATGLHVLAATLLNKKQFEQSAFFARRANELSPHDFAILSVLGTALTAAGNPEPAIEICGQAAALAPGRATLWSGLGATLMAAGRLDEAIPAFERAIATDPKELSGPMNLSICYTRLGDAVSSLRVLTAAMVHHPANEGLLLHAAGMSNYSDTLSPEHVRHAHDALARSIERSVKSVRSIAPAPLHGRPLRVGLLSGDFYNHSCSFFLEPLLVHAADSAARSALNLELVCYSSTHQADDTTKRLRALGHTWRDVLPLSDQACADAIRSDKIDVLIDCGGYTNDSRVNVLALRAAPVQMTYLGYPNTTALKECDFRIVDSITDPPGSDHLCSESLIRLDPHFLCYTPLRQDRVVPINPAPPRERTGRTTFASFNAMMKIVDATLDVWARVLESTPGSRLLLKSKHAQARTRISAAMERGGIDPSRVELLPPLDNTADHMALYNDVDVALDPFPYNGTTTTYEAVSMGVPVVALEGDRHAARVSTSILSILQLPELIAHSKEQYVALARALANDPARLTVFRRELRSRLVASPACDRAAFSARFAAALHVAWSDRVGAFKRA